MINRVILIVLDSVGIGALPDAHLFGDTGRNTFGHIAKYSKGFNPINLIRLGIGNISNDLNIAPVISPEGSFGRAIEVSPGKDTTTGHWEIAGLILQSPFPTYPNGFPEQIMKEFESKIKTKTLANKPASGTTIIEELGEEHIRTCFPIVYTSGDSVFQIAAHEEIISVKRLYEMCEIARKILKNEHAVGRVIARPFTGKKGSFIRTSNRKDYSLKLPGKTVLNNIQESGMEVMAVGKIEDIFNGDGITQSAHTNDNNDGVNKTIEFMKTCSSGLIFTNLVDFDSLYGHRNDLQGYANAIMDFDSRIPDLLSNLKATDVLIITADHGNDPTKTGSDHTREYIPVLIYGKNILAGVNIGTRQSFADIAATIAEMLMVEKTANGKSFLKELLATA